MCGDKIYPGLAGEYAEAREIGWITSVAASAPAADGAPIALGYVRHEHASPGTHLTVKGDGRSADACVSALPFLR